MVIGSLLILFLLGCAAALVAGAARLLDRRIPNAALAGFLLLAVLPYPRAFVSDATPLPLDHAMHTRPWYAEGNPEPHNPYLNDIATQVIPWTRAVRVAWKERSLPLRNRWNGCGMALAANSQSAAFSPFTFLGLLLPLARAFTLTAAVKLLLAGCGMWLWTRELHATERSAAFAAVAFALSFTFAPPWILYQQSSVFCLWPWTLFLIERCRDERRRGRAIAALTVVFALTALAGHPESAAIGMLFAGLWLAVRWLCGDLPDALRLGRAIAPAAAIAVGLTAFLLIPSVFAIGASGRISIAARPYWQPHLSLLPHAPRWSGIFPAFFPHTLGNAIRSPTLPGGTGTFCEMAMGYAGIVGWVAALLVFRPGSARKRSEWALWGLLLCGFGVAVCAWPLAEIWAHIPAIRYVFPLRFNGWVALALPAIAALELDRYGRDVRDGRAKPTAAVLVPCLLAACGIALYVAFLAERRVAGGLRFQTWQLAAILVVLGLAGLLALSARARPGTYVTALTILCGAELLYQWRGLNRLYAPAMLFPETRLLQFLHAQPGTFRVLGHGSVLFPNTNVFAGLEDIRTHDPVERRDYMAFLDATCGYPWTDYFKILRNENAPALDFLNVRFFLGEPGGVAPGPRWLPVYSGADGTVFENQNVLPRAFAPARLRFAPPPPPRPWPIFDAASAFGDTFREIAALADWRATAYVLSDGGGEVANPPIEVSEYTESTNAASFRARVPEGGPDGWVVLSLVQDGGWSARDSAGAVVPARLANGPFLALRIPPGERRVVLRYCPPGMRLGGAISIATLGLLAAAAVSARARRRPR
jgi:hypothetical protein